jgi:peptidoglycan/xylan/chitin deacetylase (PgdA/CDA1 family)
MWWSQLIWFVETSMLNKIITYPNISVLDRKFGGLDDKQLKNNFAVLKKDFESRNFTLINDKKNWVFSFSKLGITFDDGKISKSILDLNKLSVQEKLKLIAKKSNKIISPTIVVDNKKCVESLSTVTIEQVNPIDAFISFDKEMIITPDKPGSKFVAASNCSKMFDWLSNNKTTSVAILDVIQANMTKLDLTPKLSQIQAMAGKTLTLNRGSYQSTLNPGALLAMIDVAKDKSGTVQAAWSVSKVDNYVNSIASAIDTNNGAPSVGGCQYLISAGGNWLDRAATKQIILDLATKNERTYNLSVVYHAPSVGTRNKVAAGNEVIYLTFDDGMTYANQIMDYAACYGVKVTFFELGVRVNTDAAALRRAIAEGHSVQAHGYEHAMYDYGDRSYDWQYNDIGLSINAITNLTGIRPTYFRPPGGNRSSVTYTAAANNNIKLILWGLTSSDAGNIGTSAICSNVLSRAFSGGSVLMHSTRADTTNAVPCIIEGLAARGYSMQALR